MNRHFVVCSRLIVCLLVIFCCGCGKSTPATSEVRGKIATPAGVPCDGAFLVFHPQEEARLNDAKPLAIADAEGNFVVRTFTESDGAVPGNYAVTVVWPEAAKEKQLSLTDEGGQVGGGPDRLKGTYGDPKTTTIKVTILEKDNPSIDLAVTVP